jgi:hypothetical protein
MLRRSFIIGATAVTGAIVISGTVLMRLSHERHRDALQKRLDSAEGMERMGTTTVPSDQSYQMDLRKRLHDALRTTAIDELNQPTIAVCAVINDDMIMIQWLEDVPKKYLIRISDSGGTLYERPVTDKHHAYNLKTASTTVLFADAFDVDDFEQLKESLNQSNGKGIRVSLLWNGSVVAIMSGILMPEGYTIPSKHETVGGDETGK